MTNSLSPASRLRSLKFALQGVYQLLLTQPNCWIHLTATLLVVATGAFLLLTPVEWCLIVLSIALVWMAEAFNTAIEFLGDALSSEPDPLIGLAKDVAAGAVLITAIASAIIGAIIFIPRILALISTNIN